MNRQIVRRLLLIAFSALCIVAITSASYAALQGTSGLGGIVGTAASKGASAATSSATSGVKTAANKATKDATGGLININTVSKSKLMTLPGINAALSQKIINARPFKAKSDLGKIVGPAIYSKIANLIVVGPAASSSKAKPNNQ